MIQETSIERRIFLLEDAQTSSPDVESVEAIREIFVVGVDAFRDRARLNPCRNIDTEISQMAPRFRRFNRDRPRDRGHRGCFYCIAVVSMKSVWCNKRRSSCVRASVNKSLPLPGTLKTPHPTHTWCQSGVSTRCRASGTQSTSSSGEICTVRNAVTSRVIQLARRSPQHVTGWPTLTCVSLPHASRMVPRQTPKCASVTLIKRYFPPCDFLAWTVTLQTPPFFLRTIHHHIRCSALLESAIMSGIELVGVALVVFPLVITLPEH